MSATESTVDLGFLEGQEPWLLTNKFFPSKVGGRPAWLELNKLPAVKQLQCAECEKELTFLCQVYAPLDAFEECFHRTLYVFICTNSLCWQPNTAKNILVLRNQLPRVNQYYDFEQTSEETESAAVESPIRLCTVCGCRGPLKCGKCRASFYCGAAHQRIDWSLGEHKSRCGNDTNATEAVIYDCLFEEFELVTEPEPLPDTASTGESAEEAEQRRLRDYEEFMKTKEADEDLKDVPDDEFNKYATDIDEDVVFSKFRKRIAIEKEQVIRFERGGTPLWITDKHIPENADVSPCNRCGSKRIFEFQIMPQLLNSLNNEHLDWGIIAVYTCENSCSVDGEYVEEFVYKQDIISDEK